MSDLIKKLFVSSSLVLAVSLYILFSTPDAPSKNAVTAAASTQISLAPTPSPVRVATTTITEPPSKKPLGIYADGTYIGTIADAYYGNVQVQVAVQGGKLTDVQFLQYPSDRGTSRAINGQAMPYLKQEAIQAQNANVNIVSGATDTSMAFRQSLASALTKAKA